MTQSQYAVILFYSTSHAMRIERFLTGEKIECKLIPVPRQLSSDCGVCVRFQLDDKEKVVQCLNNVHIEIQGIFEI
ncbi:DUF3343 domain-containing protein [candidate division KSB1 bacterium]|nr:DUF3343 domain-containing protein [candidate division KSB1 bacterium]